MKNFFDKIGKDVQKKINSNNKSNHNRGGGQSLGGTKPGKFIPNIQIVESGPIGIKLENTDQNHAIVADVNPGGLAEAAGLQRGDVFCQVGTQGNTEMNYKEFLALVKSGPRPIIFDVKRMVSMPKSSNANLRADQEARRQAVIAAAEERNNMHKARSRPIPKKKGGKIVAELTPEELKRIELQKEENMKRNSIHMADKPLSEQAQRAVHAARQDEAHHAHQLGYNPYEVRNVTAGQASSASVAMSHGSINAGAAGGGNGIVQSSSNKSSSSSSQTIKSKTRIQIKGTIDPDFDEAFTELINTNPRDKLSKTLRILKKLIHNAISALPDDPKRQVRISEPNATIKSFIVDMSGATALMLSVGFSLLIKDDENDYLVYDRESKASWLNDAIAKMEKYENDYKD